MVLYDVIFNVMLQFEGEVFDFFKKFYKFHGVGILNQDPHQQKEF
jgi:hypothetical protein